MNGNLKEAWNYYKTGKVSLNINEFLNNSIQRNNITCGLTTSSFTTHECIEITPSYDICYTHIHTITHYSCSLPSTHNNEQPQQDSFEDESGANADEEQITVFDPCDFINSKMKNRNIGQMPAIQFLEDSATNGKSEVVTFLGFNGGNGNLINLAQGIGSYDSLGVNQPLSIFTNVNAQYAGFWHNHFTKTGSTNMFTTGDLMTLISLNKHDNIYDKYDFHFGVTLPNNDNYIITISDTALFNTFSNLYYSNVDSLIKLKTHDLATILESEYYVQNNSGSLNETFFAKFLEEEMTGLNLIKVDLNNNKYSKIEYNHLNGNKIVSPCN